MAKKKRKTKKAKETQPKMISIQSIWETKINVHTKPLEPGEVRHEVPVDQEIKNLIYHKYLKEVEPDVSTGTDSDGW